VLFRDLVETSQAVTATSGRLEKIARLAALLERLDADEIEPAVSFLSGAPRQGRVGIGWSAVSGARATPAASGSTLTIGDVDRALGTIAGTAGRGSTGERARQLRELFTRVTPDEQDFLTRLLLGELRQGALEGVLLEAVARAAHLPASTIRRAAMLTGNLALVARTARVEGEPALSRLMVQLFRPVQPMLADTAEDVGAALIELGDAALEYKLDGARIQVHKAGDDVRVYSRTLRDVTPAVPEVVELVRALPARELIVDGEVIALRPDGSPHPFQITMQRFGRRLNVEALRSSLPLTPFFFDVLYANGDVLLDEPQARRFGALGELITPGAIVPHAVATSREAAEAFAREALARGHEGVMAKARASAYAAGRRGSAWLKIKQARTLDLVVLAAEWGSGRRRGWLSNLHLGARDPEHNAFVMLGKTFKGLTDELLAWQTRELLARELTRDANTVYVRPELVVEIAFNDVQTSPIYPGGLALRFARVKRYRLDKSAGEADTFATVQEIHRRATAASETSRPP
jgi:DNA ligase-1